MKKKKQRSAGQADIAGTAETVEKSLKTEVKKSTIHAKDEYDYKKLCVERKGLLPCRYEEDREDLYFYYEIDGKRPFADIKKESREKKYQLLINFLLLGELQDSYVMNLREDNLYYDENFMLYLKERDIYGRGEKPDEERFLTIYKSFVAGVLGSKYTVSQILDSGIEICKEEKWFAPVYECRTPEEIAGVLRKVKADYERTKATDMREVKKASYTIWRAAAIAAAAGFLICGGYLFYLSNQVVPRQRQLLAANQAFIKKDYRACTESLRLMEPDEMDSDTLYILAVSYASAESFRQEEMQMIISRLAPSSDRKTLEYWIRIGRLETKAAEEIALSLSDDKLLIYAYMKEADDLENDRTIDGETKKKRLDELEAQIQKLGDKYEKAETEGIQNNAAENAGVQTDKAVNGENKAAEDTEAADE